MKNIHAALLLLLLTTTLNAQIVNRFRDSTIFYNKVQFDSIIRITEGAGNGKVLTSDGNGVATWHSSWAASSTTSADSVTIYALTPTPGTQYFCNNCTGGGITGRVVYYAGGAWRRIPIE